MKKVVELPRGMEREGSESQLHWQMRPFKISSIYPAGGSLSTHHTFLWPELVKFKPMSFIKIVQSLREVESY